MKLLEENTLDPFRVMKQENLLIKSQNPKATNEQFEKFHYIKIKTLLKKKVHPK